jgi:dienelactone hydrolase
MNTNTQHLFAYDASADFALVEHGTTTRGGVLVRDITFKATPDGAPIAAYLVTPTQAGTYAGILWGHWLGEAKFNREQYLAEAMQMAEHGAVSLLVNAMWSRPHWYQERDLAQDYQKGIQQVIEFRRALDLLLSQPQVDAKRIAFVGHDYSGMYGMVAAALQQQAKAYVFIAVAPSMFDWAFYSKQPADEAAYRTENAPLEPLPYLANIKNASFYFQFAAEDFYIPRAKAELVYATAPAPKELHFYPDEHQMASAKVTQDRVAWLRQQLGLHS